MTAPAVHQDASAVLGAWVAPDRAQDVLRHAYLGFLAARPDATARSCAAGHLTASALLFSADRARVLLTLHPRVGRWLQLGGHVEPGDEVLAAAALREATEESGVADLRLDPRPVRLDVHPITCSGGVPTRHFDVQFAAVAPAGAVIRRSAESTDLAWWPVGELPADTDASVRELVAAASLRTRFAPGA